MISRVFSDDPSQRRSPSLKNAKKIADALGISIDLLYEILDDSEGRQGGRFHPPLGLAGSR
jgi:hypothetical protein